MLIHNLIYNKYLIHMIFRSAKCDYSTKPMVTPQTKEPGLMQIVCNYLLME